MKKISAFILIFSSAIIFQSCGNGDETVSTKSTNGSTDANNTAGDKDKTDSTRGVNPSTNPPSASSGAVSEESKNFVMKAASGGMLEVQLGQLAQQKAKNQRVKDFGNMMVTDHSKANDELKTLATSNGITVPSALMPEHQKHLDMMSKMNGADFDKHYMDMMLDDHKEDISDFKKESNSNDAFKDFAAKTLPVLQKHLDSVQAIRASMK